MPTRNTSVERRLPLAQATCIASVAKRCRTESQRPLILTKTSQQSSKQKSRTLQHAPLADHQQKRGGTEQHDFDAAINLRLDRCAERERGGQQIGDHERDEQPADHRAVAHDRPRRQPEQPRHAKAEQDEVAAARHHGAIVEIAVKHIGGSAHRADSPLHDQIRNDRVLECRTEFGGRRPGRPAVAAGRSA